MKRHALAGLGLLFATIVTFEINAARAEEELRFLTGGVWRPFMFYDANGAMAGFEIDFGNAICAALAVRCTFIEVLPFAKTIPALDAGQGDAILASMAITVSRAERVDFTNPYYHGMSQFVAPKGFNKPLTPEGLKGLRIGVSQASVQEAYAREKFGSSSEIVPFASEKGDVNGDVYRGMALRKVDLILAPMLTSWPFMNSPDGHDFEFVGEKISLNQDQGVGIAVRKGNRALLDRLNGAIALIRLNGTYQKINDKYFPFSIY